MMCGLYERVARLAAGASPSAGRICFLGECVVECTR